MKGMRVEVVAADHTAPRRGWPFAGRRPRRAVARCAVAVPALAAAALLVTACGSAGGSTASTGGSGSGGSAGNSGSSASAPGAVSARQLSGVGTVLVNSSGMTVYTPKTPAESSGSIKCTGTCLKFWFPVNASAAALASSGLPGKVGMLRRPDGKTQLTYNGKPLYTFRLDTAAGQAHGSNFTDSFGGTSFTWQVVTASGKAAGTGNPAPAPSYSYGAGY